MSHPRILAIDPGSIVSGFACIQANRSRPLLPDHYTVIDIGVIRLNQKNKKNDRIISLHNAFVELIFKHEPDVCVLETAFYGVNPRSALVLGEVRGSLLAAAGKSGVRIAEISPASAKKTVAGNGRASKESVAQLLHSLYQFESAPLDATDALSLALAHGLSPEL